MSGLGLMQMKVLKNMNITNKYTNQLEEYLFKSYDEATDEYQNYKAKYYNKIIEI